MPLIILGLLVIVGIVIYALIRYGQSDDTGRDPWLAKFSRAVEAFNKSLNERVRKAADYTIIDDDEDDEDDRDHKPDGDHPEDDPGSNGTLFFPTDVEVEKRKRNIH